jgi:cytochrome c oxidase assembly protein Cox11
MTRHNETTTRRTAAGFMPLAIALAAISLQCTLSTASYAGRGTRVKSGTPTRVFVMAGFKPDCTFKGFPDMQLSAAPQKGQVSFKPGEATTIQYSLSGNCVGKQVQGTGIYYTPAPGQAGEDTFAVTGKLGTGEPATRTFSIIIDENGQPQ